MKYYNNWKIILNILLAEWKIISSKVALKRKLYLICKINRLINEFVICSSNWNHLIFHRPSLKIWKDMTRTMGIPCYLIYSFRDSWMRTMRRDNSICAQRYIPINTKEGEMVEKGLAIPSSFLFFREFKLFFSPQFLQLLSDSLASFVPVLEQAYKETRCHGHAGWYRPGM